MARIGDTDIVIANAFTTHFIAPSSTVVIQNGMTRQEAQSMIDSAHARQYEQFRRDSARGLLRGIS